MSTRMREADEEEVGGRVRGDHHFAMTPEYVLFADISANAVRLFGVLNRHAQKDDHTAHVRRRWLAAEARLSGSAYDRALAELRELGAVTVSGTRTAAGDQGANDFHIHMSPPRGWIAAPKPEPIPRVPRRRKAKEDTDSGERSHQERGEGSHQERVDLSPVVVSHIGEPSSESPLNESFTPTPAPPSPGARASESALFDLEGLEAVEADVVEAEIVDDEAPKPVTAQTILKAWIDWRRSAPNSRVLGQVSKTIKALLEEGIGREDIEAGLAEMTRRELHPSTLPSLVDNAVTSRTAHQRTGGSRSNGKPTPMQRVQAAADLAARLQAEDDAKMAWGA